MKLLKNIPFDFENKKYEIRILFGDNTINIAAFQNNYPANGFRRQIKLTKNSTPEKALGSKRVSIKVSTTWNVMRRITFFPSYQARKST